jgi:uncharacterized membrane protein
MKSRAAIGNHPIHPVLVPIPIGAFFLAFVGDIAFIRSPEGAFWLRFSSTCIAVGVVLALLAAAAGAVDYFSVKMSGRAFRTATWHALINLLVVALYTISFFLRRHDAATGGHARWPFAAALAFAGFGLLAISGWLGGRLAYEHRVGVVERPSAVPRQSDSESVAS